MYARQAFNNMRVGIKLVWNTRIVILDIAHEDRQHVIGVLTDTVGEIVSIAPMDIEPPSASVAYLHCGLIRGMGKIDGRAVTLLDLSRGLSVHELVALRSAAHSLAQENIPT